MLIVDNYSDILSIRILSATRKLPIKIKRYATENNRCIYYLYIYKNKFMKELWDKEIIPPKPILIYLVTLKNKYLVKEIYLSKENWREEICKNENKKF